VEYEYGQKWKNLYQMYKEREEMLKRNFDDEVAKLDMDQETAKLEMHTAMLRQGIYSSHNILMHTTFYQRYL